MGGSVGKSKSGSNNQFSNDVWGTQGNALGSLYDNALNYYKQGNNFMGGIQDQAGNLTGNINDIIGAGQDLNQDLAGGGVYGDTTDIRQKLMDSMGQRSNMGTMYESIVGGQGNTYVDPLINQLRTDTAQNVSSLQGGNALDAAAMGQSGSSRQAMQDAMFANQANKDLMTQEAQLRHGAYDTDLNQKMDIARMADQNRQLEQDRLAGMLGGAQESKYQAKDTSQLLQSIMSGLSPYLQGQQAGWNPLNNLANIIGGPTIIGSGSGGSKSKGFGTSGGLFGS